MPSNFEIILRGGLGNQLFQLYAGKYFAKKYGGDFQLNLNLLCSDLRAVNPNFRGYQLDQFQNFSNLEISYNQYPLIVARVGDFFPFFRKRLGLIKDFDVSKGSKNMILDGYFQEPSAILESRFGIEQELGIGPKFPLPQTASTLEVDFSSSIVIHLRMGDYLNLNDFPILSESSLQELLLRREFKNKRIYILTDSEDLLVKYYGNLVQEFETTIIDSYSISAKDIIDLLSRFHIIVLSKSSLSWWAGFLGILNGNLVFAPVSSMGNRGNFKPQQAIPNWLQFENMT